MKVLLIRPPFEGAFEEYTAPPLGIAYIAAVLEKNGHEVKIVDGQTYDNCEEAVNEIKNLVSSFNPNLVGITGLTVNASKAFQIANLVKQENKDILVAFGGPHATLAPEATLESIKDIDVVIHGEGEYTALDLARKTELKNIKGICYRKGGKIIRNEEREFIKNLDEIPFPARHLLPMDRYRPSPKEHLRLPGTSMITSRGCPYRCIFCFKHIFGNVYRTRTAKNVIDEIKELVKTYKIKDLFFRDDTFAIDKKRAEEICDEIIKEKIDISWANLARVDRLDYDLLRKMKQAGCWRILLGIESGNQDLLNLIQKDITLEQVKDAVKACKKVGIQTDGFFMLGLPGETKEHAERTIKFAKSLDLDYAQFYLTVPYPGTKLFDISKKYGVLNVKENEWIKFDQYGNENPLFVPNGWTGAELKKIQKKAWNSFYLRPSYILKQLLTIKSINDVKLKIKGLKSLLKF